MTARIRQWLHSTYLSHSTFWSYHAHLSHPGRRLPLPPLRPPITPGPSYPAGFQAHCAGYPGRAYLYKYYTFLHLNSTIRHNCLRSHFDNRH